MTVLRYLVAAFPRSACWARFLAILSLLPALSMLGLGVGLLWPWDHRLLAVPAGGWESGRIFVVGIGDRVELRVVPSSGAAVNSRDSRAAEAIRNRDINWSAYTVWVAQGQPSLSDPGVVGSSSGVRAEALRETASYMFLSGCQPANVRRLLLAALRDPDRFVAAHVLLGWATAGRGGNPGVVTDPLELSTITYDHLRLGLPATQFVGPADGTTNGTAFMKQTGGAATADPAQIAGLFNLWSYRLGKPVGSVDRFALAVAVCAVSLACLAFAVRGSITRWWRVARRGKKGRRCSAHEIGWETG